MRRLLCLFVVLTLISSAAFGQQQERKKTTGPRRQLAAIVFAGLGGAVLGLSTLSFYGRPQDYLVNIAIGFAVGVIAGTVYVTFRTATTREYYEDMDGPKGPGGAPPPGASYLGLQESELVAFEEVQVPKLLVTPSVYQETPDKRPAFGAQLIYNF